MKKIKLMLEYHCCPIWMYNDKGELIGNELPTECNGNIEIRNLVDEIQKIYDNLFIDDGVVFEYIGFINANDKQTFLDKANNIFVLIKNNLENSYVVENKIDV